MRRLRAEIQHIREDNARTAEYGCALADHLRRVGLTPSLFDEAQDALRRQTLFVEDRLRTLAKRRKTRGSRLDRRFGDSEGFRECRGEHIRLLKERESALLRQRAILRQIGDAQAWLVLREDPQIIAPLYADRTHFLPDRIGLIGAAQISSAAHRTGRFLVLENDLTRCLGVGDLTIVRADGDWTRPLIVEVKTHGRPIEGTAIHIDITTTLAENSVDSRLFAEFKEALDLAESPPEHVERVSGTRQHDEMLSHTRLLHRMTSRVVKRVRPPNPRRWDTLRKVFSRALIGGGAFDIAERGIAYVAVRHKPGDDAGETARNLNARLQGLGFTPDYDALTSAEFQEQDRLASLLPPIPLWEIPLAQRRALLTGELEFASVASPTIWRDAMREFGLNWEETEKGWLVRLGDTVGAFSRFEVTRLLLGVGLLGLSPRDIAQSVRETLTSSE